MEGLAATDTPVPARILLRRLRPRARRFLRHFIEDPLRNQGRAYIRAGYTARSMDTAYVCASQLLRKPKVVVALEALERECGLYDCNPNDIMRGLARLGFSDIRRFVDPATGKLLDLHQLEDDEAHALKKVKVSREKRTRIGGEGEAVVIEESLVEVELHDKLGPLTALARIKGLLKDRVEHDVDALSLEVIMQRVNELADKRRQERLAAAQLPVIDATAT